MNCWGSFTGAPTAPADANEEVESIRPVRVLVADDDDSVRRVLVRIISSSRALVVVGVAADATDAIRQGLAQQPDVALLDVSMPGGGGVHVTEVLRTRSPHTRVLALSGSAERDGVMGMLAAGASGYLVKGGDLDLVSAVLAASRGEGVLTSDVAADVIGELGERLLRQKDEDHRRQLDVARIEGWRDGGLRMVFQPVVDLDSGLVEGYEALARFPGGEQHTPDRWFETAWKVGLGYELETAAVEAAMAVVAHAPAGAFLAVNLSPQALTDPRCKGWIESLDHIDQLVVEVTEHAVVEDYAALNDALRSVRSRGARIAVDDAGAGYSSFRHVLMLMPDFIKLDGSLVAGIDSSPAKRALAVGMISSARELATEVIAESIEQEAELQCVLHLGARLGQGYHLGRPGPLFPGSRGDR